MARKTKSKSRRRYKAPMKRKRAAPVRRSAKSQAIRRRRTKRNPKGFFQQPAVKFGIAATIGAGVSTAINARPDLRLMKTDKNPAGISPSYAAAALTIAVSQFFLKGRNRQLGYAAGVGMLLPAAGPFLGDAVNKLLPAKNGNGNGNKSGNNNMKQGTTIGEYTARRSPMLAYSAPRSKFQAVQATTSRMKSA